MLKDLVQITSLLNIYSNGSIDILAYNIMGCLAIPCHSLRIVCNFHNKGCFTLWLKVERPLISINRIARNQSIGLLTLLLKGESLKFKSYCSSKCLLRYTFLPRRQTLEGSLDHTRMETQTMVKRLWVFFLKKNSQDLGCYIQGVVLGME